MANTLLLDDVTEDTDGAAQNLGGGPAIIIVSSTDFGGGTVTIEVCHDSTKEGWQPVHRQDGTAMEITANTNDEFIEYLPSDMAIRATLTGSTTPDALMVKAIH